MIGDHITEITFPQKDEDIKISYNAFEGCSSIINIVINNIAIIDKYTFSKYTKLEEITIPNSITKIDEYAPIFNAFFASRLNFISSN